jgi:hypothetical protein
VNVYDSENQAKLTKLLSEVTENAIRHQRGFLSVSVHASLDGRKVVNYAQWASKKHFDDFMKQPSTPKQLNSLSDWQNPSHRAAIRSRRCMLPHPHGALAQTDDRNAI